MPPEGHFFSLLTPELFDLNTQNYLIRGHLRRIANNPIGDQILMLEG